MEGGGLIELLWRSGIVSIHFVPDGRMTRIQFTRKRQTCFLSGKLLLKSLQTQWSLRVWRGSRRAKRGCVDTGEGAG